MIGDCDERKFSEEHRRSSDIKSHELVNGFARLKFFNDNPFLRMQAHNIALVDSFIMGLEDDALRTLSQEEHAPPQAAFLSAQTQMWIFAAYELMRTWRQRARELLTLAKDGQLQEEVDNVHYSGHFRQYSEGIYHRQARELLASPDIANTLEADLRVSEIPFVQLEIIRMPLAKHEIKGQDSLAYTPGYARICEYTGSLKYEIGGGFVCLGHLSRRNIADGMRNMAHTKIPTPEEIKKFRAAMKIPSMKELGEILSSLDGA